MLCYIVIPFLFCYTAWIDCVGLGFAIFDLSDWQVRRWHFEELAVAQQLLLRSLSREQTFTSNAMGETLFCRSIAQMMAYIEKVQIKTDSHTSPKSLHKKSTPISHHLNWTFQSPRDWYLWKGPFLQFQLNCKLYPKSQLSKVICHRSCSNMVINWNSDPFSSKVCDVSGPKMWSILMLRTMQDVPRSLLVYELDDFFLIGSAWRDGVLFKK